MAQSISERPRLSTGVFTAEELEYFESLGPDYFAEEKEDLVGETDYHYLSIQLVFQLLMRVYPDPSDVHIAANNFIYWDRTQKGLVAAPDLYLVKGAGRQIRGVFKTWMEGNRTPNVVFEFASSKTWRIDLTSKKDIYEQKLRVPEYFLFDPIGDRYPKKLQGFRLERGAYRPIPLVDNKLYSEQLDLELLADGIDPRFYDPRCGELIPSPNEVEQAREQAELKARTEATVRAEVERDNARLRAELDALRGRLPG